MSTLSSPARRVLGEKDPNAPLLPTYHSPKKAKFGLEQNDSGSAPVSRQSSPGRQPAASECGSARAGQKRKIDQVEEVDEGAVAASHQHTHPPKHFSASSHQVTDTMMSDDEDDDSLLEQEQSFPTTSIPQTTKPDTPNTTFTSLPTASQEDPLVLQVDPEFEIHDEPSQQTLDKMHAVTLSQNTSQLLPHLLRPALVKESSQVSLSLSSLIDFETNLSSQSDDLQPIEETATIVADQRPKTEEDSRKEMLLEKAETLRTRLQLAIFKVRTNQISRPFARLQVPRPRSTSPDVAYYRSSSPHSSSSSTTTTATLRATSVQRPRRTVDTPETRVATARARATMDPNKAAGAAVKSLSSLPMPKIVPTTFSARWNDGSRHDPVEEHIPSSPPLLSSQTVGAEVDDDAVVNVDGVVGSDPSSATMNWSAAGGEPRTPVQLSGGGRGRGGGGGNNTDNNRLSGPAVAGVHHHQQSPIRPGGLTSSVIKGEAAHCLLELVRGGGGGNTGGSVARSGGMGMCGL